MDKRLLFKFIKIWWEGFTIFCGYSAFWIILIILCLPVMVLIDLVGEYAGYIIGSILSIFIVPIIFFLTFKYLLLWGDKERHIVESDVDSTSVVGKRDSETERAILFRRALTLFIVLFVFSIAAAIITPPDVVSQVFVIAEMVIIYGIFIFIISRFKPFSQTPETIKKLIVVLVCLLSITISYSLTLFQYYYHMRAERSEHATSVNSPEAAIPGFSTDTSSPANAPDTMVGEK